MRTDAFDYDLPREFIAQHPAARRDDARLLVLDRAGGTTAHRRFRDIGEYLGPGDLLVLNDTRVVPARLIGHRETGGWVELLLIAPLAPRAARPQAATSGRAAMDLAGSCRVCDAKARPAGRRQVWRALVKCRGHLRAGESLAIEGGAMSCTVRDRPKGGEVELEFDRDASEVLAALDQVGRAPLPPYIKRPRGDDPDRSADRERYQTVYASQPGAIAAPTAGLHFTAELLEQLAARGVRHATVTLHVGLGTFRPVTAERIAEHVMHAEYYELSEEAATALRTAREAGGHVVAVGTTATRVLEAAGKGQGLVSASGWTDLFITPGFEFRAVDRLLTNFHLPRSTLLMLVAAFAGLEPVLAAYEEAKQRGYRFYSYGDAMLIL